MNATGLLKLAATGIQDTRLTAPKPLTDSIGSQTPKRGRYTTRWERLNFEGVPQFGQQSTLQITTKGHLLKKLYLIVTLPNIYTSQPNPPPYGWTNSAGHALVEETSITIAGAQIQRFDSRLLEILDEYHTPLEHLPKINKLIMRDISSFSTASFATKPQPAAPEPQQLAIPLPFWFTCDPALALPVDAINADMIRLTVKFRALAGMLVGATPTTVLPTNLTLGETYVMGEYVYLDKYEANRFRLADIELPIIQYQALPPEDTKGAQHVQIPINVNNPMRALYCMAQTPAAAAANAHFHAGNTIAAGLWPDAADPLAPPQGYPVPAWLSRPQEPFTTITVQYENFQRWYTDNPAIYRSTPIIKSPYVNRYYYCLPFSELAEPISAPKGEANLGRIERKWLHLDLATKTSLNIYVYLETLNVLRIYGGRAGLLF